jgi:hypothetical protein
MGISNDSAKSSSLLETLPTLQQNLRKISLLFFFFLLLLYHSIPIPSAQPYMTLAHKDTAIEAA